MDPEECRELFSSAAVARLATSGSDRPHIVPIVFAIDDDEIVTAVDRKPKRSRRLQRILNIERDHRVTLLADHYEDDWNRLWWVRADGEATVVTSGSRHADSVDHLAAKYPQYLEERPDGPVIAVAVTDWRGWRADAGEDHTR